MRPAHLFRGSMASMSVALGSKEGRAFFQERLALFAKACCLIALSFYVLANLIAAPLPGHGWLFCFTHPANRLMLANCVLLLTVWQVCRRVVLSQTALSALDAATLVLNCAGYSLLIFAPFPSDPEGEVRMRVLLGVTNTMIARSILIPSTARRSFLLSLLASAVPTLTTFLYEVSRSPSALLARLHTAYAFLWCLCAATVAAVASRIIFGLRQEVREARQLGQYTLVEKIGEGGMGAVYRASHAMLRRPTAVKLLPLDKAGRGNLERFEREVQLTSRLTHPNTVSIFDYGRTADGVFYYAMEYLEGINLQELVRLDGAQTPGRVIHILRQVLGSLGEAHGVGLIHRDVKPANIILGERGGVPDVAKVVDFGLVKDVATQEALALTRDHTIAGTPLYLSPEAIRAESAIDGRSDLYAVGAVAYFLLTAQPVFAGANLLEICGHHLHTAPADPSERLGRPIPEGLSAAVMTCLEKKPERRPASSRALLETLERCEGVTPWTEADARAWWREYEAKGGKSAVPAPGSASLTSAPTLSVELKGRAIVAQ